MRLVLEIIRLAGKFIWQIGEGIGCIFGTIDYPAPI
jgi:hypothetical protein